MFGCFAKLFNFLPKFVFLQNDSFQVENYHVTQTISNEIEEVSYKSKKVPTLDDDPKDILASKLTFKTDSKVIKR